VPPSRPPAPWQDTTQVPDRPVSRRKLLWAAAAIPAAAVAGAVAWEASRPGEAATGKKPTARTIPTHDPEPRWQAHVPFGHGAVLAAAGGLVIVAGGLEGPHGNQVRALDARTGQPAWSYTGAGVIDQVAATDQAVYLATDPVAAVRLSDGSELWSSPHTALYGPVESGGTVYVAEGVLYALRAQDGGLRWQYPADVTSHPVVAGGMLYTLGVRNGSGGTRTVLHAIRAADGAHQWDTPAPPGGVLATDGQVVCAVEGEEVGEPGRLWVWRASNGKPLWHGPRGTDYGVPALDSGVLYVVRADGTLFAYRAASGRPLWTAPSEVAIAPAVSAGVVYASDDFGRLVARRAADGKVTWTVPHRFTEGPLVAGQTIIITNGRAVLGIPV
jgi:outer membrane protein assembly factor BamB